VAIITYQVGNEKCLEISFSENKMEEIFRSNMNGSSHMADLGINGRILLKLAPMTYE
jgi:hypothetical protein